MRVSLLALLLCSLVPALASAADPSTAELMAQGRQAYVGGDYETAKQDFGQVVLMDPTNTQAIQFLRAIKLKDGGSIPATNDPIKTLVLSKVELKDATFGGALDYFKQEAARQSVNVSFVSLLPPAQMTHPVTLSLNQVPFLDALRYLCTLNSAVYKVDRYAITIMPASGGSAAPSVAQ